MTHRYSEVSWEHEFIAKVAYELSTRYPNASQDTNWYAAEAILRELFLI
jgi:hypothetical protein